MPKWKSSYSSSSSLHGGNNHPKLEDSKMTRHCQLDKRSSKKRKIIDNCRDNDNDFDGLYGNSNGNGSSVNIVITKEMRSVVPEVLTFGEARLKEEVLQIDQEVANGKEKILESTIEVINSMFTDADPDFLQEKINACMTLGNDEKALGLYIEELLNIKKFPTMKDYMKRMNALAKENSDTEELEEEGDHGMCHCVVTCSICLEDVSYTEMGRCNSMRNEHIFCLHCIRKYTAAEAEQGRSSFKCMDNGCSAEFSLKILRKVMNRSTLARVCEQRQHEEVSAAKIENLEFCPFCNYKAIMTNQEDKIFVCMNPRCMKNSCRLCKREDHIPLRCSEVKVNVAEEARKKLENKMSEAIIRECPQCGKRFIKLKGCNKMTCSCGASICYYCRHLRSSDYHKKSKICGQQCNQDKIHQEELRSAAIEGKKEMDPNIKLTHDPTIDALPNGSNQKSKP